MMTADHESYREKPRTSPRRRILSLKGLIIGIVAGLVAVGFRICLEQAEKLRGELISFALSHGFVYFAATSLVFGLLIALVVFVTSKFAPEAGGSGIPHLKGYLAGVHAIRGWRILFVKFLGGILGIGSGLALGREGPTVQMGAAVAKILGDRIAPNRVERKILISAGAGAGLAAAFNAPLAGVFFVLEELQQSFNQAVLVTAFVACVTADIICRLITGHLPVFHIKIASYPALGMFPFFLLLGVFLGFLGLFFNKSLLFFSWYFQKLKISGKVAMSAVIGLCLGLTAFFAPKALGTGTDLISDVMSGRVLYNQLIVYFVLRFFLTMASYSTGAPGGIFAPMLLLGVISGAFFGHGIMMMTPTTSFDFTVWGVLGMAGYFAAVVRAPITGTILILEMTNAYNLLLPLMIVSIISYSIPEYFKNRPIYEALLNQYLLRRSLKTTKG